MAEYIEREAVKAAVRKRLNSPTIIGWLCRIIDTCAAADVEPVVHGRWEAQKYWKHENKHYIQYHTNRCSLCHCDVSSRLLYNYCPNCGAHMKDGE